MGKLYEQLDDRLIRFIERQQVFFVATAPRADDGHVNLSPKGLDSFRVLGPSRVAYLDLTGSGAETLAHLAENGRITLLFCAFEGPPLLVRMYGRGRAVTPRDAGWEALAGHFPSFEGSRSVVVVDLERIADSCGYGVPIYEFSGARRQLLDWSDRKGPDGIAAYQAENNRTSIDGLPALPDPD